MDLNHFGLRQRPFQPLADCEFYYPASSHERVLGQIRQAIDDDESLCLATGEAGLGKTVLCHRLLDALGDTNCCAFLTYSLFTDRYGLLQSLAFDLSLPYQGLSEEELRLSLVEYMLKNYEAGKRSVLVIDEAQGLTIELLEELRQLTNLEGRQGKAAQVILVGLPGVQEKLEDPCLASLRQRLTVHAELGPLDLHESADYLVHQLRAAGGKPSQILSDEAAEILARWAQGIPRLLNRAAHSALSLAHSAGSREVDAEVALEAIDSLGSKEEMESAGDEQCLGINSSEEVSEESFESGLNLREHAPQVGLNPNSALDPARSSPARTSPRRPA